MAEDTPDDVIASALSVIQLPVKAIPVELVGSGHDAVEADVVEFKG